MRTKTLLGAAALVAGLASSAMAQSNVYSLNVVGYYNLPLAANQKLIIANQLNTTNNTIGSILSAPMVPDSANFFKYNGGFTGYAMDYLNMPPAWDPNGNATLNPGEAGFFQSPTACTLTFVGTVLEGSLTNTLPLNSKVMRSSIVPQAGGVTTVLGLVGEDSDNLFTFSGGYTGYAWDVLNMPPSWDPHEPVLAVGQGFFYTKAPTSVNSLWIRNFTVQ